MNAPLEPALLAAQRQDEHLAALMRLAHPESNTQPPTAFDAVERAIALAQDAGRSFELARASAWRCIHLSRQGRYQQVLHDAPPLLPLLSSNPELLADCCELMRVLALCACEVSAFDVALDTAHELARITAASGEDGAALNAAFALAACFERMGDSWQALRLLTRALLTHGDNAPPMPLLVASNGLCAISIGLMHRLLGVDEHSGSAGQASNAAGGDDTRAEVPRVLASARAAAERALSLLERVPSPAYEVAVLGNLGEVMLHQGEVQTAGPSLRRAHALALERGLQGHAWRVQATLGNWLMASGRPTEALAMMQALLAEMGRTAPAQTVSRAQHVAYRACRVLGRYAEALAHFEEVERGERQRTMVQLRAQSQLFVTRTEAQHAQWQADQARLDAQQQRERAATLAASAECDPLTGLGNRRHLERRCTELLPVAQAEGLPLALAQIDIDHFKAINDLHGHATGDRVLVAMAQLLRDNMRAGDVLARHGGEEFVIVLPGMGLELAAEVCERLRECVAAQPWATLGGPERGVTISIGLAAAPGYDMGTLLERADQAMYRAKREGRNRLRLSQSDEPAAGRADNKARSPAFGQEAGAALSAL